jgi:CubicO group peptidase (beta-lactamase class C family)
MRHLFVLAFACSVCGQQTADPLADLIRERFDIGGYPSIAAAVVQGDRIAFAAVHGFADRTSSRRATRATLYRIGSVSKVFTTSLLVQLRDKGLVRMDDPVSKYLPPEVKLPHDPRGAKHITLRHLATHSSGLPRNPVNMTGTAADPWNGYSVAQLYEGLAKTKLAYPTGGSAMYSNLGVGLLGYALGQAAGSTYEEALTKYVLQPAAMSSTRITLDDVRRRGLAAPYTAENTTIPAKDWDLGCLEGAGAIASTVTDLARFISMNLHAGDAAAAPISGGSLTELHTPQRIWDGWTKATALAWIVDHTRESGNVVWHNGGMAGFRSWVGFSPRWKIGAVVLTNCGRSVDEVGKELLKTALRKLRTVSPAFEAAARTLVPHFVAKPSEELGAKFSERFLEQVPASVISNVFSGLHQKHGKCVSVVGVRIAEQPELAEVVFRFERGELVTCKLGLDETVSPPKIVYLRF